MASAAERFSYKRCQFLAFDCGVVGTSRPERFIGLACKLGMPVTRCKGEIVDQTILNNLARGLQQDSQGDKRSVLFLCGGYLDEQVSFAAHFLLEVGFDTRLIRDLIAARDADHMQFHDQRLIHSGALPTTSRQLVYEWMATEADPSIRQELQSFSEWTD
jgi:hypothetical protein